MAYAQSLVKFLKEKFHLTRLDVEDVLSFVFKCSKESLCLLSKSEFETKQNIVSEILSKKQQGHPLEYLLGFKTFYSLDLKVNHNVLIPRQETEILVDKVVKKLQGKPPSVIFDVCCGSGAIGLSLKKAFPKAQVYLSDISSEALDVARENAERNNLDVNVVQGDLLASLKGLSCDLFISNPPYIAYNEYSDLELSVKNFEPKIALCAGSQGYEFYERFSQQLPQFVNQGATMAFEIGFSQKNTLNTLFSRKPYHNLSFEKDFAGVDRFFFLEIE